AFPYVNGKLFEEHLPTAAFDSQMRSILMECCLLDWGKISPAIFGSLFQSVMDAKARRNLGAHYTSERNILKLIKPLFLDELTGEFNSVKDSKARLQKFHDKISGLRFLDPACGCGNFLIIAYREIRLLEIEIIKQRLKLEGFREEVLREAKMDVSYLVQCDVDRFYGIEYEEFPAQIAQVAMWLADHQMNQLVSNTFGEYYVRLPLRKSATIVHGNALHIDWQSLIAPIPWENGQSKYDFILGNPPFIGSKFMTNEQRTDIENLFQKVKGAGTLDYVSGWYSKAAKYMQEYNFNGPTKDFLNDQSLRRTLLSSNSGQQTTTAFVSTNSIAQGEQVGILWNDLFIKYKIKIHFAHRTFSWSNEARGNAAVHVVIIGFANFDIGSKRLFEYEHIKTDSHEMRVKNISPYLVEGADVYLTSRQYPISNVPPIGIGNKPIDGGSYLFSEAEKKDFVKKEPQAEKYFKKWLGSDEFINGYHRWCLWLGNCPPHELKLMPEAVNRIEAVRKFRMGSKSEPTRKLSQTPTRFHVENMPLSNYLIIPEVSSERRKYIPMGFQSPDVLSSNLVKIVPNATLFHFGILTSEIHMCWVKYTCGRLKSDFRYSKDIVYNNFPWPENPTEKQVQAVEAAAQNVLDVRAQFPESSLADLYDPNTMPPVLVKAHQALDKAVELCYRPQAFVNETKRIEFLFELYDKYTAGLFVKQKKIINKPR
ncbi:MAG: DNA methyltransferase, partial [Bacteroidota bacterium]